METHFNSLFNVPVLFKQTNIDTKPLIKYISKISKNSKIVNSNVGVNLSFVFFSIKCLSLGSKQSIATSP